MKLMYACLKGEWVNLNEDEECLVNDVRKHPAVWVEESLLELFDHNYINIIYKGNSYRIHPSLIQIITTPD